MSLKYIICSLFIIWATPPWCHKMSFPKWGKVKVGLAYRYKSSNCQPKCLDSQLALSDGLRHFYLKTVRGFVIMWPVCLNPYLTYTYIKCYFLILGLREKQWCLRTFGPLSFPLPHFKLYLTANIITDRSHDWYIYMEKKQVKICHCQGTGV